MISYIREKLGKLISYITQSSMSFSFHLNKDYHHRVTRHVFTISFKFIISTQNTLHTHVYRNYFLLFLYISIVQDLHTHINVYTNSDEKEIYITDKRKITREIMFYFNEKIDFRRVFRKHMCDVVCVCIFFCSSTDFTSHFFVFLNKRNVSSIRTIFNHS